MLSSEWVTQFFAKDSGEVLQAPRGRGREGRQLGVLTLMKHHPS